MRIVIIGTQHIHPGLISHVIHPPLFLIFSLRLLSVIRVSSIEIA